MGVNYERTQGGGNLKRILQQAHRKHAYQLMANELKSKYPINHVYSDCLAVATFASKRESHDDKGRNRRVGARSRSGKQKNAEQSAVAYQRTTVQLKILGIFD